VLQGGYWWWTNPDSASLPWGVAVSLMCLLVCDPPLHGPHLFASREWAARFFGVDRALRNESAVIHGVPQRVGKVCGGRGGIACNYGSMRIMGHKPLTTTPDRPRGLTRVSGKPRVNSRQLHRRVPGNIGRMRRRVLSCCPTNDAIPTRLLALY
jgi:hypothetical protein